MVLSVKCKMLTRQLQSIPIILFLSQPSITVRMHIPIVVYAIPKIVVFIVQRNVSSIAIIWTISHAPSFIVGQRACSPSGVHGTSRRVTQIPIAIVWIASVWIRGIGPPIDGSQRIISVVGWPKIFEVGTLQIPPSQTSFGPRSQGNHRQGGSNYCRGQFHVHVCFVLSSVVWCHRK